MSSTVDQFFLKIAKNEQIGSKDDDTPYTNLFDIFDKERISTNAKLAMLVVNYNGKSSSYSSDDSNNSR